MATIEQTPEQIAAENERQAAQSYRFRSRNPRYKNTPENGQKLADYLVAHGLSWDVENLEDALEDIGSQMLMTDEEVRAKAASTTVAEPAPKSEFPWPTPLSAKIINGMSGQQFLKYMEGPSGAEFKNQVAALKLHRG